MAESESTKVIGITADGVQVFENGLDANGRKVTHQATSTSSGLLQDGTTWTLLPQKKG